MDVPPRALASYRVIDMHTAGEPVRIVLDGFPEPRGDTVLAKRADAMARLDVHRRRLMLEPRGHPEMYGALPVAASVPGAAFGVLFMHHSGFSTMCGHATVALGRWAVDSGRVPLHDGSADFVLECPCGPVDVHVTEAGARVAFDSVPGFAAALDLTVEVPAFGRSCAISAMAARSMPSCRRRGWGSISRPPRSGEQRAAARAVTDAIRARHTVRHPAEPDLGFLYGTILTDDAPAPGWDQPQPVRLRRGPDRSQSHRQRRHRAPRGGCRTRPSAAGRATALRRSHRRAVYRRGHRGTTAGGSPGVPCARVRQRVLQRQRDVHGRARRYVAGRF